MTITAVLLVILSATMHAGWNLFSKSHSPTIGFFKLATIGTILWFAPILFLTCDLLPKISLFLWGVLLVAGFFQAVYYAGLAGAYSRGALSIAYPLARSIPILLLMALTYGMGKGDDFTLTAVLGMLAIVAGAFILPMNSFRDFRLSNFLNPSCAFTVVAAVGTAGYSFVDDIGMDMLGLVPGPAAGWARALLYLILEGVFTLFWLQVLMFFLDRSTEKYRAERSGLLKPAFVAGLAIGATYGIILLAMTYVTNVSYVVALRQLSIPIGTVLGIFLLKEKGSTPRFVGLTILFAGLVLVAIK
ncbi:MAG: multidrug DMT transporter permease [Desulfobacterales bacterium]|nr:MAG: multidrug DMT transporter permease [Desulfobacterales bacterium]